MAHGSCKGLLPMLLLLVLTGCWDRREIEEYSNVVAAGVDICEDGPGCEIVVSRQVAIPGRIPLGAATVRGGSAQTVFVLRTGGKDGPTTSMKAQAQLNRQMSFGHTRVLLFSEAFARRGMAQFVDYMRRLPDARRLLWVAVSEGRAEAVVGARPSLEPVPALFLNDMFDDAIKAGRMPQVFWGDFLTRLSSAGEEPVLPVIRMVGPDQPALAGLAVFRDTRMVGKLDSAETVTYMQLSNIKRGSERLRVALAQGGWADLAVSSRQTNYRVRWVQRRVMATVRIELEAQVSLVSPGLDASDPRVDASIEQAAAKVVRERAGALVRKLQQEYHADILALGERVRAYLPAAWAAIDDWPAAFAEAEFQFDVAVHVRSTGPAKR